MPKRTLTILLSLALIAGAAAALPAQQNAQQGELDDATVMNAAGTIFSLYLYGAAGRQYEQTPEGVSYHEDAKQFRYEKVDLSGLSKTYTKASGTITREAKNTLSFDFTLTGGPVDTITYRIARDESDPQKKSRPTEITVNGSDYTLSSEE